MAYERSHIMRGWSVIAPSRADSSSTMLAGKLPRIHRGILGFSFQNLILISEPHGSKFVLVLPLRYIR